ncbi:transmembrane protein 256 homolog [Uranotaenia lowii]|uniref:transmembrane protein 256 homolog n=1 Tax=Uranotaenia lowii TaxID=190385 RepID=UPI00247907F9|nr:transmembrane protein 256 homolog [Uranotaenia lowii]
MYLNNAINYVCFDNRIAKGVWSVLSSKNKSSTLAASEQVANQGKKLVVEALPSVYKLLGHNRHILKLAGLSGVTAIIIGGIGAHTQFKPADEKERDPKSVFETANRYHMWSSLALLAAPLARKPYLTATFLVSGITMFSGVCYYIAFTQDRRFSKLAPVGSVMLIIGWLSFML